MGVDILGESIFASNPTVTALGCTLSGGFIVKYNCLTAQLY